jgi:hypothetical protein
MAKNHQKTPHHPTIHRQLTMQKHLTASLLAVRVKQLSYLSLSGVERRQCSVCEMHFMQLLLMPVGPTYITDIVE